MTEKNPYVNIAEKIYLRLLAICYFVGGVCHLLDVLSLRLNFHHMDLTWKVWIVTLLIADFAASLGLWFQMKWGVWLFLSIAFAQLIAYSGVLDTPRNELFLIGFHGITVMVYFLLRLRRSGQS